MRSIGIVCSDLHFSALCPVARSAEPDWFLAQFRYLDQLKSLQENHRGVPIIIAGDIFDRWYAPATTSELINRLMLHWPDNVWAVPGQHDLPNHQLDQMMRTPYWTMVQAGKINDLTPGVSHKVSDQLRCHGFPWGHPVFYLGCPYPNVVNLAVVHAYIWQAGYSYPDAPKEQHAEMYQSRLSGFDAAVFGDNHQGFLLGRNIINCGTFMRRKADERDYKPMVGVLYDDGHFEPHYLDTSDDLWLVEDTAEPNDRPDFDATRFIDSLKAIGPDSLDFHSALQVRMRQLDVSADVRQIILDVSG